MVALVLVVAGCVAIFFGGLASRSSLTQHLPDGSAIAIRKVSYGKTHRCVAGTIWERTAGALLPDNALRRLGIRFMTVTNASDRSIVFVETFSSNAGGWVFPRPAIPYHGTTFAVSDDVGNDLNSLGRPEVMSLGNSFLHAIHIPLVSHAATELRFEARQYDYYPKSNYFAAFTIPNPAPIRPSRWSVKPFPLTNDASHLKVVLLELSCYPFQRNRAPQSAERTDLWTYARFQITKNGMPIKAWQAVGVTVLDEEGNAYRPSSIGFSDPFFPDSLRFNGGFSHLETRKFRFRLSNRNFPFEPHTSDRFVEFLAKPIRLAAPPATATP